MAAVVRIAQSACTRFSLTRSIFYGVKAMEKTEQRPGYIGQVVRQIHTIFLAVYITHTVFFRLSCYALFHDRSLWRILHFMVSPGPAMFQSRESSNVFHISYRITVNLLLWRVECDNVEY